MANGSDRGVAYDFWVRVKREQATRGWTDEELRRRAGGQVARTTIDRLEKGKRPPAASTVNALAKALDIDLDEAHQLARLVPGGPEPRTVSAREAVRRDPMYTDTQRRTMLELMDIFERTNGEAPENREREAG